MSRHLKWSEWLYYFQLFETNTKKFETEYFHKLKHLDKIKNKVQYHDAFKVFKKKYKLYMNTKNINVLISHSGRKITNLKKQQIKKQALILKKKKHPSEYIHRDDLDEIIKHYIDLYESGVLPPEDEEKIRKIIERSKTSCRAWSSAGFLSKSTINRIKNRNNQPLTENQINRINYVNMVFLAMKNIQKQHNNNLGRRPLKVFLEQQNIKYSDRYVGRLMNKFNLKCQIEIRQAKPKEIKNTEYIAKNYANRDYDNLNHENTIISLDTTYIPIDYPQGRNFAYLTAAINWKTKEIVSYDFSISNDLKTVMNVVKKIKGKNIICHSDHGFQFTNIEYIKYLKTKLWTHSLSRVGNSLDNRPIEYFFRILKTELVYKFDNKLSFEEMRKEIHKYINYYNNKRIQKKLNWLSPIEFSSCVKI